MSIPEVPEGARVIHLHGKVAAGRIALVDESDFPIVRQYRWHVREQVRDGRPSGPYAVTTVGPTQSTRRGLYMHRLISGWERTDHKNHNGLDNRRMNLRAATRGQNLANQRVHVGTSSAYKGVHWNAAGKKWVATMTANGFFYYLGSFARETDAAITYDTAALSAWGEFAFVNFPTIGASQGQESPAA